MKHLAFLILASVAACGDGESDDGSKSIASHEEAADQTVRAMKQFEGLLDSVKDKASADSAKPKLEALAKRLDGIEAAVEKLGPPAEGQGTKCEEKMRAGFESLSPRVFAYIERIMTAPEAGKTLEQPFSLVQQRFMQLRGMLGG